MSQRHRAVSPRHDTSTFYRFDRRFIVVSTDRTITVSSWIRTTFLVERGPKMETLLVYGSTHVLLNRTSHFEEENITTRATLRELTIQNIDNLVSVYHHIIIDIWILIVRP